MGVRHSKAHFNLRNSMETAAAQSAWDQTPPQAQAMLEDAFYIGGYCVFFALTDPKLDAIARLSIISQLSEQFDNYMKRRAAPVVDPQGRAITGANDDSSHAGTPDAADDAPRDAGRAADS